MHMHEECKFNYCCVTAKEWNFITLILNVNGKNIDGLAEVRRPDVPCTLANLPEIMLLNSAVVKQVQKEYILTVWSCKWRSRILTISLEIDSKTSFVDPPKEWSFTSTRFLSLWPFAVPAGRTHGGILQTIREKITFQRCLNVAKNILNFSCGAEHI